MKYIKNLVVGLCLSLLLSACGENDDNQVNTTDTTVGFGTTSITIKENTTFLNLPIYTAQGESRNGDILLRVIIKETSETLHPDHEVILTTETLRIPAGETSINAEIALHAENEKIEKGRYLILQITEVQGASLANSECTVYLSERNFIEGTYLIRGLNPLNEIMSSGAVNINAQDETMDHITMDFGLGGTAKVTFTEIIPDKLYHVSIEPFAHVGNYNGKNIYLSWLKKDESTNILESDRQKPITGIFEQLTGDDKKIFRFTMNDAFGLMSINDDDTPQWYSSDIFGAETTITKEN